MAWPRTDYTAAYDKLANTFDRSLDSKLWPALLARSPLLEMVSTFDVDRDYYEWENQNVRSRIYTEASSTSTDIEGSTSGTTLVVSDATGLEAGAIIKNATRATPVGTYGCDELMEVTVVSSTTLTVVRDVGRQNSGTGSAIHALADTFEVIYTPKEEGSSIGANLYTDVSLVGNYTNTIDFAIMVTGTQAASKRIVADDSIQTQLDGCMRDKKNELESMLLYGALNNGANAGSDSYVKRTKGIQNYLAASGANIDYGTNDVTEDALNDLIKEMLEDNVDENDPLVLVSDYQNFGKIVDFGMDKVVIGQTETQWGRTLTTWRSKYGPVMPLVPTNNCSRSDVFLLNMKKVGLAMFRPWMHGTLEFKDDLVDARRDRFLCELGVKVVDPLYAHALLSYITWS